MADIGTAVRDLVNAAKELGDAHAAEEAAKKDEAAKRKNTWDNAAKAVMKAKGKQDTAKAGDAFHEAEALWKKADTELKKATAKRKAAEDKFQKAARAFNDALMKLIFP